ncbi:hypothetical protein BGZ96_010706 [Linnemannia gamsii]|uniref:BTB domain-containing protein n=1 Tax=Linnemannia gamsii TaxID=64522 RepID=A0ABQ7JU08_9FUNG|nr:hypothetical protein BGZ96_010706 [Linnemannia gamsii]
MDFTNTVGIGTGSGRTSASQPSLRHQQSQQRLMHHQRQHIYSSSSLTTSSPRPSWMSAKSSHIDQNTNNCRPSSSYPSSSNQQNYPSTADTTFALSSYTTPWTAMAAAATTGTTWTGAAAAAVVERNANNRGGSTLTQATTGTRTAPMANELDAPPSTRVVSSSILRHITNISQHLALYGLVHGTGSDISLRVFGTTYRLHRLVLLQATFFENMLQGPWQERSKETVDITFDDPNITQEGFDIAIGCLYGVWAVEREDESVAKDREYELDLGARHVGEQGHLDASHSSSNNSGKAVAPSILSPRNVLSVLAVAAYLGMESLCEQCTDFAIRALRTEHLLPYIEFSQQSDYYPWSDKIIKACHSYLCRYGYEDPKMACLQVFERLPLVWMVKVMGSDAFWVPSEWERYEFCRQIVHRRRAIASILRSIDYSSSGLSSGAESTTASGGAGSQGEQEYEDEDEMAYEALFSSGIIYMHMSLEQLQCIQRDIDPISGLRFVRSSVIQEALWHQIEFRSLIETHSPKEPTSSLNNNRHNSSRVGGHSPAGTDGSSTIGLFTSDFPGDFDEGYDGSDWIRRPFAMYKPIPEGDATHTGEDDEPSLQEVATWNQLNHPSQPSSSASASRMTSTTSATMPVSFGGSSGSNIGSDSSSNSTSCWSQLLPGRHRQSSPPSNPAYIQLAKKQRTMESVSDDAGNMGYGLSGSLGDALGGDAGVEKESTGQYSIYPPFRFSVTFRDVQTLKEHTRVCSDAFFYAGSYWNLYIQKLPPKQPGAMQLGVYLHRHSLPNVTGGVRRKPGLAHFFTSTPSSHPSSAASSSGCPTNNREVGMGDQYIGLPILPRLDEQLRRLQQPSASTAGAGVKLTGGGGHDGNDGAGGGGATTNGKNTVTAAAATLFENSFSCFVDKREMTKTWFKIYAIALGPHHAITHFQSKADDFPVMQSWGWKSSSLCSTAYLPESPVPKDDMGIKVQTGCNCTGLLVSQGCSSLGDDTVADMTVGTTSIPQGSGSLPTYHQSASTAASAAGDQVGSVAPAVPTIPTGSSITSTNTTTVTETMMAMDVDYVHEYEYDEDNQQQQQQPQQQPQECHSPRRSATPGFVGTSNKPLINLTGISSHGGGCECGNAGCTGVIGGSGGSAGGNHMGAGGGGGDRIFIRAPMVDTFAIYHRDDTGAAAVDRGRGGGGGIEGVSCNCEAQSRYGPGHHHHPLQATMLQFSIVMGHV